MTLNNAPSSDSPAGPPSASTSGVISETTNSTNNLTGTANTNTNSSSDANPTQTQRPSRTSELFHTAMRAYPVVEALAQSSHRNDVHSLAHASRDLHASISASRILGNSQNWPDCPGDKPCYRCGTPLCAECCLWKIILPPSSEGCWLHSRIRGLAALGESCTSRYPTCKVCDEETEEEEMMKDCWRLALDRVPGGLRSLPACPQCTPRRPRRPRP